MRHTGLYVCGGLMPSVLATLLLLTLAANCSGQAAHERVARQAPDARSCTTADGRDGTCIPLRACPPLDRILRLYKQGQASLQQQLLLRQETFKCHFRNANDPRVCCASGDVAGQTTPQQPVTSRTPRLETPTPVTTPVTPPVTPPPFTFEVTSPPVTSPPITPPPTPPTPVTAVPPPTPRVPSDPSVGLAKLPDELVCGTKTFLSRIFGGQTAEIGAWPWVASIGYRVAGAKKLKWNCGAALITSHHVLTAAHCVTQLGSRTEPVMVRLGELDFSTDPDCLPANRSQCADRYRDIRIERIDHHELYEGQFGNAFEHDIALVRLVRSAEPFTDFVRPICLPIDLKRLRGGADDTVGSRVFITGWGRSDVNSFKDFTPELQEASIRIVSPEKCETSFKRSLTAGLGSRLCAGEGGGVDTCRGDSGGPLMTHDAFGTNWYLTGLTSFGSQNCGQGEAVYTRVSGYIDWILNHL